MFLSRKKERSSRLKRLLAYYFNSFAGLFVTSCFLIACMFACCGKSEEIIEEAADAIAIYELAN